MAAITTTIDQRDGTSTQRIVYGHFTPGANTGGEINTSLEKLYQIYFMHQHSSVVADKIAVNETMPCAGNNVTIVHTSTPGGIIYFMAIGR